MISYFLTENLAFHNDIGAWGNLEARAQDLGLLCDTDGGFGNITGNHSDGNTSLLAGSDGIGDFWSKRISDTSNSDKGKLVFKFFFGDSLDISGLELNVFIGDSDGSEGFSGEGTDNSFSDIADVFFSNTK